MKQGDQRKLVNHLIAVVIHELILCCDTAVTWFLPHRIYQACYSLKSVWKMNVSIAQLALQGALQNLR